MVALVGQDSSLSRGLQSTLESSRAATVTRPEASRAVADVNAGRLAAVIFLPDSLQQQFTRPGGHAVVTVLTDPASRVTSVTVVQLVKAYFSTLEAGRAGTLAILQAAAPRDAAELGRVAARAQAGMQQVLSNPQIQFVTRSVSGQAAGYFSYYAIAFGVMFTLMSAALSAGTLVEEDERGTLLRLQAAPIGAGSIILGKGVALYGVCVTQLGLFAALTSVLFGVQWGPVLGVVVGVLVVALGASGLGGVILATARTPEQVNVYSLLLVILMSLIGGSMWPLESLPATVQTLSRFTFNRWAIEVFQTIAAPGLGVFDASGQSLVLAGIGIVGLTIAGVSLNKRISS